MKKLILLLSIILISASVTMAQSLATEVFSELNGNLPAVGANFNIPVNAENFPDQLRYIEFFFQFDENALTFTGTANPQNNPGDVLVQVTPFGNNIIRVTYLAPLALPPTTFDIEDGKLIDLQFDYLGGNSPLDFLASYSGSNTRFRVGGTITPITSLVNGAVIDEAFNNTIAGGVWENPADWSLGAVPTIFHNVFVDPDATDASVISSNAVCNSLTINAGGQLTVNDGFSLTVAGDFLIESDVNATGSFVNLGSPLSVYGTVKQFMTGTSVAGTLIWHLISVPVNEIMSAEVFLNCYLQTWDEPGSTWVDVQQDPDPAFTVPMNTTMLGYSTAYSHVLPGQNKTIQFNGILNDGTYSIAVTNDGTSGNINWDSWNLVGNPYPSSLDVDASGWTRENVSHGVAYWDESIENYKYYGAGVPANGGTQFIPPMQGFFVKASTTGVIGVSNEARAHSTQNFYKSDPANTLRLVVQNGNFTDEAVIRFMDEANENYHEKYDFFKLFVQNVPQIYSITNNNETLAINALPAIDEETPVNIGFKPGVNAMMTLTAKGFGTFDSSIPIWLVDHAENVQWNLRENPVYNFVANVADDENRFSIHFKNFTGVPGLDQPQINIYAFNRQLYVDAGSANNGEIVVVNVLGQELVRERLTPHLNILSLPVSNSYVVVKVISDQGITSRKVFVN